ncbi:ABC transporter substrate-binding protein [Spelaeicoccus albus]|uniref:Peptide/nickel transport system substrate-binding protein n=1 Tax=Spelaeicoccus albus TaxID=1280376 RepID=A0A7Z0D083_9MICO|nr:ABC transporter substrate-binding protein [Spelaeicoccus albus]NYI67044.1 peptide/nickel transport system substrate-binding protein [Spelaeicoccus albus]
MPSEKVRPTRRAVLQTAGLSIAALSAAGLLNGCGQADSTESKARKLRVAQSADPLTLDPQLQGDLVSMNVLINIFDTLTTRDVHGKLRPRLALEWGAPDRLTWRFKLRKGVKFHNGEKLDAHAVKFSIERLLDPKTKSPIVELIYVKGVTVVDDYTVDFNMSRPDPIIPEKVSLFGGVIVPPQYISRVGSKQFATHPVGSGPYKFVSWKRDDHLKLVAADDHWDGTPAFKRLEFLPMPNPASELAALQSDGVDLVSGLTPEAALQLKGYKGVKLQTFPGIRTSFISLDTEDKILKDPAVRRALNHAVNVPMLIREVLDGKARVAPTMIPRESFGFDPRVKPFARSVSKAKRMLAEAGYPNGFTTTFTASNADTLVAQAIKGLLAKAGVHVELKLLDPGTFSERLTSTNSRALGPMYLTASTGWTLDGEATMQSYVRSDRRQSRLKSKKADSLIDRIENQIDPDKRLTAFKEIQRFLHDEAPFIYLYQIDLLYATDEVATWTPNVIGTLSMDSAEVNHG